MVSKSEITAYTKEPKLTVEYKVDDHGRLFKIFHLTDYEGREIALDQKSTIRLARNILKICTKEGK